MTIDLTGGGLTLAIDPDRGHWLGLRGGKTERSWIASADTGLPFVAATGIDPGKPVALPTEIVDGEAVGVSHHGGCRMGLAADDRAVSAHLTLPNRRGPRSGLRLDLDHLDRDENDRDIRLGLMPVMIETAPDLSWAWLAWQRGEDDLLVLAIDGVSAGWHIRYSYAGHRMLGFDVLARADDVIADGWPGGRLPTATRLTVHLAHADSRAEAQQRATDLLGLAAAVPSATGVSLGARVSLGRLGNAARFEVVAPDATEQAFDEIPKHVTLPQPGTWVLQTTAASGRVHESRVLAVGDWREMAERAIGFHREHYQLSCGAMARVLNADRKPEGYNFGGNHFGDPDQPMSCRTGEFGGFGAWAQHLHQPHLGPDPAMADSFTAYLDWLANRGREDDPRPGTICRTPQTSHGLDYSPGHLYQEICYAQHETWLIHQLADAIDAGDTRRLPDLQLMVSHYLRDHVDEAGVIWNQNFPDETPVDYSTVDCPLVHLIGAQATLQQHDPALADRLATVCREQAQHLHRRGFDFPTEGEPCTEDGSIACQAWGLAHAYNQLPDPDPAWIELADQLMLFHAKLELSGSDVRLDGSTLRFWETQYESDDWGPSINAGHGWTLWSALARWELFRGTGGFTHLHQAWRHTTCVASRLQDDGSFPPCWTPDPVPALPHDDAWGDPAKRDEGRLTTAAAGMRYPTCLSMSGMFLFITAPQMWYRTCGYDPATGILINARLIDGVLEPMTPLPCTEVALGALASASLEIVGLDEEFTLTQSTGERHHHRSKNGRFEVDTPGDR